jgi:hypothetical protein
MWTKVAKWIAHAWSKATRETIVNTWNGVGHTTGDHEDNTDSDAKSVMGVGGCDGIYRSK